MINEESIANAKKIFEESKDLKKALEEFSGYGDETAILKFLNEVVDLVYSRFYWQWGGKFIEGYYSDDEGDFVEFEYCFG